MARVVFDDYSNRVINVVKAKYALKDKSEALNKFIHTYGHEEDVEEEVNDKYLAKILNIEQNYYKKHGQKKMSLKELDNLFGK